MKNRSLILVVSCLMLMVSALGAGLAGAQGGKRAARGKTPRAGMSATPPVAARSVRAVAVTIDDLPSAYYSSEVPAMTEMTRKLLGKISASRVPAIGFVNEGKLMDNGKVDEARLKVLKMWLDAGLELGNHTYAHIDINSRPFDEYKENIVRGETYTRQLLREKGMKLRYFRHPYLHTGKTPETKLALEKFLSERGYTVAPVTIDNDDYIYAAVYSEAKRSGDRETMQRVLREYVPYMERIFEFYENYSKQVVGYEMKQILLIHANELNADTFDQLAAMMRRRGYRFISLGEALTDPAYRLRDDYVGSNGISWLHRWAATKGMKNEVPTMPDYAPWLQKPYDERMQRIRAGGLD